MTKLVIFLLAIVFIFGVFNLCAQHLNRPVRSFENFNNMWFDSLNVQFVGNWPFARAIAVVYDSARQNAFCGSGGGVYILDLSTPANPIKLSEQIHTRGVVCDLFYDCHSKILYIADSRGGIEIWDITDQTMPSKLSHFDTPDFAEGVYVVDSFAYVAANDSGLYVLNVSDPQNPREISHYDSLNTAIEVFVTGSFAYVSDWTFFFHVIDISNPTTPQEVGSCFIPCLVSDIFVHGLYAFVVGQGGLCIVDISTPTDPQVIGNVTPHFNSYSVYVLSNCAYVSDNGGSLRIFDISTPSSPVQIANLSFSDTPLNYVYRTL